MALLLAGLALSAATARAQTIATAATPPTEPTEPSAPELAVWAEPAAATPVPTIESARALWFAAEFERAAAELREIAASPTVSREDLVEVLRYLVPLEHTLGRPAEALEAARALLLLAPEATMPEGAPAGAVTRFDALRAHVPSAELRLDLDEERAAVSFVPASSMLPTLTLACTGSALQTAEGGSSTEVTLALDPRVVALCDASLLSVGGAPILTSHAERAAVVLAVVAPAPEAPPRDDTPWPWIAVAGGAAVVVIVVVAVVVAFAVSEPSLSLPAPGVIGW